MAEVCFHTSWIHTVLSFTYSTDFKLELTISDPFIIMAAEVTMYSCFFNRQGLLNFQFLNMSEEVSP